jgi:hypothetical protein
LEDLANHLAVNIGEPEISTLESVRQPLMMDAHLMQQGGLKIMHVNWVVHGIHAEVICLTV